MECKTITEWYKQKNIFITGGSGYMGKVLIEKMLRSIPEINKIYVLIKPKRGQSPAERIASWSKIYLFKKIVEENPNIMKKIIPIAGDLSEDNLGISEKDKLELINEVSIVFHLAATLKLEADVKNAVKLNTEGTLHVLELCKQFKQLEVFLHSSTIFCYWDVTILDEKMYPPSEDPYDIIQLCREKSATEVNAATARLLKLCPNSYIFSKRLAETIVDDMKNEIPIVIARPSIVLPTLQEPFPGWVDSLNGPIGIIVAAGKGVMRTMYCDQDTYLRGIPVDVAANAFINIAYERANKSMVRVQNKITFGLELLEYFSTRNWLFINNNALNLEKGLSKEERQKFPVTSCINLDPDKYLEDCLYGARTYCLKENPKSLLFCRIYIRLVYTNEKDRYLERILHRRIEDYGKGQETLAKKFGKMKFQSLDEWYKQKCIFITGGTGYMGKVLIEKILRSLPQIDKLYVLTKSKRGQTPQERIKALGKVELFRRIMEENPTIMEKIIPITGDISEENLGISEKDRLQLINDVSIVFHLAATLRLEANLKDAVQCNVEGTLCLLQLCKQFKKLEVFVHVSTIFCCWDISILEEKVYPSPEDPYDMIEFCKTASVDEINAKTSKYMKICPNSYIFSKRLAETIVNDMRHDLPITIARPSIVLPSLYEPFPGWVDSLNGPIGVIVAAGKGVLRTMFLDEDTYAKGMPVDVAINCFINMAYKKANGR
ncbi:male sterility protein 2-related [Holotrichia oblita]|uniref:Male sterility protein 2-related n=1 Tax=Holotrichia oblita TaxID=644536 RepID=A0ACB9T4E1_HOLOL|nr:male sterility protein 2-related [Holotrichia oblita]